MKFKRAVYKPYTPHQTLFSFPYLEYNGDNKNEVIEFVGNGLEVNSFHNGQLEIVGNHSIWVEIGDFLIDDVFEGLSIISPQKFEELYEDISNKI